MNFYKRLLKGYEMNAKKLSTVVLLSFSISAVNKTSKLFAQDYFNFTKLSCKWYGKHYKQNNLINRIYISNLYSIWIYFIFNWTEFIFNLNLNNDCLIRSNSRWNPINIGLVQCFVNHYLYDFIVMRWEM